jgi:hypothetical protein
MESIEKAKWVRPKLIVLLRGRPEEMLLHGCKRNMQYAPGGGHKDFCYSGGPFECSAACKSTMGS